MSSSADAHLIYGYNLEGPDGWEIQQTGEWGDLELDWFDDEDADTDGFVEACQDRLLATVGITEAPDPGRYFDREKLVRQHFGVRFFPYGHCDYARFTLCAHEVEAYGWSADIVDLADLAAAPEREGWDAKLQHACEVLGITPKQAKPAWILTSSYG